MTIDEYVARTRTPRTLPRREETESIYNWLLDSIKCAVPIHASLRLVNAGRRECCTVELNGQIYVIYDVSLRACLHALSRVFFNAEDPGDSIHVAVRLWVDEFRFHGNLPVAVWLLGLYNHLLSTQRSFMTDRVPAGYRHQRTLIQECFILSHELIHCLPRPVLDDLCRAVAIPAVEAFIARAQQLLQNGANVEMDVNGNFLTRAVHKAIGWRNKHTHRQGGMRLLSKQLEAARHKSYVSEECVCDLLATHVTLQVMQQTMQVAPAESFEAICLGLQNLRFIAFCKMHVALWEAPEDREWSKEMVDVAQTRYHTLRREGLNFLPPDQRQDSWDRNRVNSQRNLRMVHDPVFRSELVRNFERVVKLADEDFKTTSDHSREAIELAIDQAFDYVGRVPPGS